MEETASSQSCLWMGRALTGLRESVHMHVHVIIWYHEL